MDERISKLAKKPGPCPNPRRLSDEGRGRHGRLHRQGRSLRDRVGSYFQKSSRLEHKKIGMLDHIADFETIDTDSEVEALLAENRLIKDISRNTTRDCWTTKPFLI